MKMRDIAEIYGLYLSYGIGNRMGIKDKNVTKWIFKNVLHREVKNLQEYTDVIAEKIEKGVPLLVARLGGTEGVIVGEYCERQLGIRKEYRKSWYDGFFLTTGFFADDMPNEMAAVDRYAQLTLDGLVECDYLSAMFPNKPHMPYLFRKYAKNAVPVFSGFGPYLGVATEDTWVRALEGKRVLVVNSFTDSIKQQYCKKDKLVADSKFELPDFELLTYKTLVTHAGERTAGINNWFQAYDLMLKEIKTIDFDIALIGAGSYGFPLAVEIKKMGKIAIETCGSTPLFFGVYGERNVRQGINRYMTADWIRPIETPAKNYKAIEGGCYW